MWNKGKAIAHLNANAHVQNIKKCGVYTRMAIAAGGISLTLCASAKDYGPSLQAAGFVPITDNGVYLPGDVVVINGYPGNNDGHMAMYNGTHWVSDFVQRTLYPGPRYREFRPAYTIYRKH